MALIAEFYCLINIFIYTAIVNIFYHYFWKVAQNVGGVETVHDYTIVSAWNPNIKKDKTKIN